MEALYNFLHRKSRDILANTYFWKDNSKKQKDRAARKKEN